jgi:hypothetical protein
MIDASAMRMARTALTLPSLSTTASASMPIRQVPEGWYEVPVTLRTNDSMS